MRRTSSLIIAALLATTACTRQVASPMPRPVSEAHSDENIWRQEYPGEFTTADRDWDDRLDKSENAAFLDLVHTKRLQAAPPALPVVGPSTAEPVPGPAIGVMLPPLPRPLDQGQVATPWPVELGMTPPPPPIPVDASAPDPQGPPAGMTLVVLPIPPDPATVSP